MLLVSDYKYNGICPQLVIDRNYVRDTSTHAQAPERLRNTNRHWSRVYLAQHNLLQIAMPIHFNGFNLKTYSILGDTEHVRDRLNTTLRAADESKTICYYRVYVQEEYFPSFAGMFSEAYKKIDGELKTFFDKMCADANSREENHFDGVPLKVDIYYNQETLTIYEFVTRQDYRQMSDVFLILGVMPIIFPSLKEKLEDVEEDYFKTLVRRSQIKRINNSIVEEAFSKITALPKYIKAMEDVRINNVMEGIVNARVREAQQTLEKINRDIQNALSNYEEQLNKQQIAQHQLLYIEDSLEETKENLRSLLDMKCIQNITTDNYGSLVLCIRVPVDNYNPEEADIVLSRRDDGSKVIKILKDIFVEQIYTIYFAHNFKVTPGSSVFQRQNIYTTELLKVKAMCNPHLHNFSCYGSYLPVLQKAHQQKDFGIFATTAAVCTANLNFADSAVINWFISILHSDRDYYNIKCIEDDNGELWSFKELIDGYDKIEIEDLSEEPQELDIIDDFI